MNRETLAPFAVAAAAGRCAWAAGGRFQTTAELAAALAPLAGADGRFGLDGLDRLDQETLQAAIAAARRAAANLRQRAAFTLTKPASSRSPLPYHMIPAPLRMAAARLIGRAQRRRVDRWAAFPGWPLDLSADLAADLAVEFAAAGGAPSCPPGAPGPTPVLLSHDLDSPEGVASLTDRFLAAEEAVGARSVSYVVPCAWPVDHARLAETAARGHEIGVHGYDHANRTPFAAPEERRRRLDAAQALATRYGAVGYRAPSLLRTPELLADLAGRYRYDSSIPTSGGLFPTPNNGCASARPYRLGGVWEIPLSMPRDGSLLFLGWRPAEIAALWRDCAEKIAASGGVVCLLTHCEAHFTGGAAMFAAYRAFLDFIAADNRFFFTTPTALLDDLDRRAAASTQSGEGAP